MSLAAILFIAFTATASQPDILWRTNAHNSSARIAFSPDGKLLISAGTDRYVKIWNAATGVSNQVFNLPLTGEGGLALFQPPDAQFVEARGRAFGRERVWRWRVSDGELIWTEGGAEDGSGVIEFSPDGTLRCVGYTAPDGEGTVGVTRTSDRSELFSVEEAQHREPVTQVRFSPDGSVVASASFDKTAKLFSAVNGEVLQTFSWHTAGLMDVAFLPDGKKLVTGSWDGNVKLWSVTNGAPLRTICSHPGGVVRFAVSPDGKLIATAGDVQSASAAAEIRFWRMTDGALLATYDEETDGTLSINISPDGKLFAYGRTDGVLVVARMPLLLTQVSRQANQLVLMWQGSAGRYQVQRRSRVDAGEWQNVGEPTTATRSTNAVSGDAFYRVIGLPSE